MPSRRTLIAGLVGSAFAARAARAETRQKQSWAFDLEEVELHVKGLDPAHDGLRVGQLTDIHIGANTPDGRVIAAVDAINAHAPDLVVLTGDYVTRQGDPLERVPELLGRLHNKNVTAVLGNHDHWTDAKTLRRYPEGCGFCVLQNQNTTIDVKGRPFSILGVDDAVTKHADVSATFQGAGTGSRLVLAHAPPTVDQLPKGAGLACLSGHTHGGQIYLGPVTEGLFGRVGQPYVRGHYAVNGNSLYVSRGLGFGRGSPLMRVGSEPEVTIITLRAWPTSVA
jgi:hypothetical protein